MEVPTPCPYCENFEASGFETSDGKIQTFRFCPVCGRPYPERGTGLLNQRAAEQEE